jgi:serine/threonine-protein kinase
MAEPSRTLKSPASTAADPALPTAPPGLDLPAPGLTAAAGSEVARSEAATLAAPPLEDTSVVDADLSQPLASSGPRYKRGELIGLGGMGEVRLHRDARIGRQVALKTLRGERSSASALARFVREARVQGQLEHPSVVPVYDLGVDEDGRPFFTMKRVRGETLSRILDRLVAKNADFTARFTRHRLLSAFARLCLTIEYAHASGVVHRDLKPSNLMLGDFGEAYVLDWGVAKLTHGTEIEDLAPSPFAPESAKVTREGEMLGTPLYMAPEQMRGRQSVIDGRADVYALGAILFEILTLEPMRKAGSLAQIIDSLGRVERPSQRAPGVPPDLDDLCVHALHPDPEQRLPSAQALADGIERHLEGDRDIATRQAQARRLLEEARAGLARAGGKDAMARVEAMRSALKALALSPEDAEAQQMLVSLVIDSSGSLPPEAERELGESDVRVREQGARLGIWAFLSWLAPLLLSLWVGVLDWTMPATLTVLVLLCALTSAIVLRVGQRSRASSIILSVMSGLTVAGASCWLGPFVLVPAAAAGSALFFVIHSTPDERPWLVGIWATVSLLPFAVELSGKFPPAYSFVNGDIVLHARSLRLPEGPTIAGLAYLSVSFLVLLALFIGRLRDRQRAAERSLFVQAWHLRQLFPAAPAPPASPPP